MVLRCVFMTPVLPTNFRQGQICLPDSRTTAYYTKVSAESQKGFITLGPGGGKVGAGGLELGGSTHLAERVGVGQRPANSGF